LHLVAIHQNRLAVAAVAAVVGVVGVVGVVVAAYLVDLMIVAMLELLQDNYYRWDLVDIHQNRLA
jgi:zinc transporter ZupT